MTSTKPEPTHMGLIVKNAWESLGPAQTNFLHEFHVSPCLCRFTALRPDVDTAASENVSGPFCSKQHPGSGKGVWEILGVPAHEEVKVLDQKNMPSRVIKLMIIPWELALKKANNLLKTKTSLLTDASESLKTWFLSLQKMLLVSQLEPVPPSAWSYG